MNYQNSTFSSDIYKIKIFRNKTRERKRKKSNSGVHALVTVFETWAAVAWPAATSWPL